MKKVLVLTLSFLFVASSSFAAAQLTIGTFTDAGKVLHGADAATADGNSPLIGKTSTGVGLAMQVDATLGAGYSLATQHKAGSKAYASSYDSTSIYSNDITIGTAGITLSKTDSSEFNTWKAM